MIVDAPPAVRLMVNGLVQPDGATQPLEARRGMIARDAAGDTAGTVAGILIDGNTGRPTHLVLCRDMIAGDYRLVAVERVADLDASTVRLRMTADGAAALPRHQPDGVPNSRH